MNLDESYLSNKTLDKVFKLNYVLGNVSLWKHHVFENVLKNIFYQKINSSTSWKTTYDGNDLRYFSAEIYEEGTGKES